MYQFGIRLGYGTWPQFVVVRLVLMVAERLPGKEFLGRIKMFEDRGCQERETPAAILKSQELLGRN